MSTDRRTFLAASSLVAAASLRAGEARAQAAERSASAAAPATTSGATDPRAGRDYTPITVPNGRTLPWKRVGNAKVFHLVAEPVKHEMAPGLVLDCWGYNGSTPGPVIEAVVGDRLRIYVTNRLPEPTTVHWHGIILPSGMDGVTGLNQRPIGVGQTYRYEFVVRDAGTFMYHPHYDEMTQLALGMMGMIVVHPQRRTGPRVDRDYVLMLGEWDVAIGASRPNPITMSDFNMLTFNSKAFPGTEPLVAESGERIRIRFGNLGPMDHHPVHLHGHTFLVTGSEGGPIPPSAQWPTTTVLVPVGTTRDVELIARPGDWAMHCHMTHHMMNQMGHDTPSFVGADTSKLDEKMAALVPSYMTMGAVGMGGHAEHGMPNPPNSIPMKGAPGPLGYIDMGGMFTILKVRDRVDATTAESWHASPEAEQARPATADELAADGIETGPERA